MVNVCHYKPTGALLNETALALFQQQWQLYRKFVDNNYFYHREVYGQLHRILVDEAVQPFFLIYENASPDVEDRDGWLLRWERQNRPLWTALTPEEYETMAAHVRFHDFPETTSRWHSLSREAGSRPQIVYRAQGFSSRKQTPHYKPAPIPRTQHLYSYA
jgi:hypothetical protein